MYIIGIEAMYEINVTELRNHLPQYLSNVAMGAEILVTSHGRAIARIMPPIDKQSEAVATLKKLRKSCKVGDVVSPVVEAWDADQ